MSKKFSAHQHILISGSECGTEIELKMAVDFTVHPGCKQTLTEPGEEPSVEINDVQFFDSKDELTLTWSIGDRFASSTQFKDWLKQEASEQHEAALDAKAEGRREELRIGDI